MAASDEAILDRAAADGFTVVTTDSDFGTLLAVSDDEPIGGPRAQRENTVAGIVLDNPLHWGFWRARG